MPSTNNKDKPWDTEDVDKWKVEPFSVADNAGGTFAEESSFSVLFPKYRELYLKTSWPLITRALEKHGISCTLDMVEGCMTVKTTRCDALVTPLSIRSSAEQATEKRSTRPPC